MRRATGMLVAAALIAGCGQAPDLEVTDADGQGSQPHGTADVAWEHLDQIEDVLPDRAAAAVFEDPDALAAAWERHGFDGDPPTIDFDVQVVLLVGQADDGCPDELTRLEVVGGDLEVDWLPPPGGCIQPLIMRLHAVMVHRGVLGAGFDYGLDEPYAGDLLPVTIDLPPFDGAAPAPPEPPRAMSSTDLDAVFAGHTVVRCGPEHEVLDLGPPDDGGADDAAVDGPTGPVAEIGEANDVLAAAGIDIARDVIPFMDRSTGGRLAYFVGEADAATIEQTLVDAFGDRAPGIRVAPWAPRAVAEAQDALMPLMGGERRPGAIVESTGGPGPVRLGMIDPTREALDAVAETVDPDLVCVEPILSGVPG